MANGHTEKQRIKDAYIPIDAEFNPIREGWDIEQMFYPAGWSWVQRFHEQGLETDELHEVVMTRPLIGWALVRSRETGESVFVGITADAETARPYPVSEADGFEGYEYKNPGLYISGGPKPHYVNL